ncbi:MAG: glycosyltransferase [Bacteroidetes bacterium]|nr:glycosyltransferase [Bacteroidota bacterium]
MAHPKYSIVVPVYNRPEELRELLQSLAAQSYQNFEVVVVEDGSTLTSDSVVSEFSQLSIRYFIKPNTGPGPSRNFGFEKAIGDYFVIFDSDCILPPTYFEVVEKFLKEQPLDAWGGPDRGHEKFTTLQQAMAYTMSSVFTTGGIRGSKKGIGNFQPRSFNMGLSRQAYEKTNGFQFDRFAEDIELSIRMKKLGLLVGLIPEAFVYHKRRSTLAQFFKQVFNFGRGRVLVGNQHPGEVKWVHWFPLAYTFGLMAMPIYYFINYILFAFALSCYLIYSLLIFADGLSTTRSLVVALLTIPSSIVQLTGYGLGFLTQQVKLLQAKK